MGNRSGIDGSALGSKFVDSGAGGFSGGDEFVGGGEVVNRGGGDALGVFDDEFLVGFGDFCGDGEGGEGEEGEEGDDTHFWWIFGRLDGRMECSMRL